MSRGLAVAALLLWQALPARAAECEGVMAAIREDIRQAYRMDVSCADLEAAARAMPIATISATEGLWGYAGERDLRADLAQRLDIRFSTGILPLGTVEREAPEGGGGLLVFGLDLARPSWALLALSQHEGRVAAQRAAEVLGEGAVYDRVGVYARDAQGRLPKEGVWLKLDAGGTWSEKRPAPIGEARVCQPCRGWLCPPEPIVCFTDFDLDGREELLLIDDCKPHACGLRLLEPGAGGKVATLLNEPGVYGQWTRRAQGWVLVSEVYCPWGEFCGEGSESLGNPNCERPDVYRLDAKAGRFAPDPALQEEYYPIEDKPAPRGCEVPDRKGVLVWTTEGRFVRFQRR